MKCSFGDNGQNMVIVRIKSKWYTELILIGKDFWEKITGHNKKELAA